MAIFTNTKAVVEETLPEVGEIMGTMEASDQILYEAAEDFYKINAGLYISDILIEQAVTEGSADPEALMEGTIKDFFKKIIEALKKFWAKVKAWFKGVIENIKVLFMSGEKFIKEYEKKLKEKKATGFKYRAYKYNSDASFKLGTKVGAEAAKVLNLPTSINADASVEDAKAKFGEIAELDSTDFVEKVCSSIASNCKTISDIKKECIKVCHNNSDEPQDWVDFNGNSKDEMIDGVKNYKKSMDIVNKMATETDAKFSNLIKAFTSLEKSIKDNSSLTSVIGKVSTNAKSVISLYQGFNATAISLAKEEYATYLSILKRYAVYKDKSATKESATTVEGSLLESAMALL